MNKENTFRMQPGEVYKLNYGDGHSLNKTLHIKAVITDKGEEYVVYKYYIKAYRSWIWEVNRLKYFEMLKSRRIEMKKVR